MSHNLCHGSVDKVIRLKLIDCETKLVIAAPPSLVYVALSYVRGEETNSVLTAPSEHDLIHSQKFSKTIQDAIYITKELGYQCLWVDKYCIDQGKANEKHQQIGQMDEIYQAADLTIIASSGFSAYSGLPGVDGTPRKSQLAAKYEEFRILSTMTHPYHQIPASHWASRGWTLQERVYRGDAWSFLTSRCILSVEP